MLKKPLIIGAENWKLGMKVSPYSGFSQFRGLDPHKIESCASIERAPVAMTGATLDNPPTWIVIQPITFAGVSVAGTPYFLTGNGKLYKISGYTTYSHVQGTGYDVSKETAGYGLVYWKGCIWVIRAQYVDYYDIANNTWHYQFRILKVPHSGFNPAFVGQDDKLYIGDGQWVAAISETSGATFSPSAGTGIDAIDDDALKLAQDYVVSCFAELNDKLMIGTQFGTSAVLTKVADIFPWSRNTAESFLLPICLNEEGINSMLISNNLLYISAGYGGNIYVSNGVSASPIYNVPLDTKEKTGSPSALYLQVYPDAFDFQGKELLLGVSQGSTDASKTENPMGVYGFLSKTARFLGNGSYAKNGSDGTRIVIGSIYSISPNEFLVGWQSGTDYGIDYYGPANNRITSYGAYCHSPLYVIGTKSNPATIESYDFYLAKPLATGDGIKLSYRTSRSGGFILLATLDYATMCPLGTEIVDFWSFSNTAIKNAKSIQFLIEMTTTGTSSPELHQTILQ